MLISYALLIFALTSSVVAFEWQILQGNPDKRLPEAKEGGRVYRWYRLKELKNGHEIYPAWPEDRKLDHVIKFVGTNGIESVSYYKLRRNVENHDLLRNEKTSYGLRRKGARLDDERIPLEGFWGRARGLDDVPEGLVGPVVDPDEIIEIEKSEGKRCVRFLEDAEKLSRSFSPARTVYSSSRLDPWQKLEGNTNLARLVEEGPHPIRVWYQLKIVKINECPTWPMDADLDRIMRFISTNGRITSVSYMRLRRVKKGDRLVLAPDDVLYPEGRENLHVNDWAVPLDGLWGRQWAVTDPLVENMGLRVLKLFDRIIEIKTSGAPGMRKRKVRFLEYEEMKSSFFCSALTEYNTVPEYNPKGHMVHDEHANKRQTLEASPSLGGPK